MARPTYVLQAAFASNPEDPVASQVWTDITRYLDVQSGARIMGRGRGDDGQVQPAQMSVRLNNSDGRFTMGKTGSPYYPNVVTGKRIRLGLMWPGNGKQLDTDPSFNGAAPFGWESKPGFAVTTIAQTSAFAQSGSTSMQLTLPTAASGFAIARKFVYGLVAGRTYTASAYIRVPTGSPTMAFGCTPGTSVATTVTNAFQQRTVTFTATDPFCEVYVYTQAASTAGQLVQVDALQVEEGSSATTFESTAGVFQWRFTGDVNQWPTGWEGGSALLAWANVTASDRFKRLGDLGEFRTTLEEDVLSDGPFVYYPLQELATSTTAGDVAGNNEAPLQVVQVGAGGALALGEDVGASRFFNTNTTTVGINPAGANNGKYLRAQLKTPTSTAALGATVLCWARESATPLTTGPLTILTSPNGSWFGVTKIASGNITVSYYDGLSTTRYDVVSGVGLTTGNATQYGATLDFPSGGTGRITFYVNSISYGTPVTFPLASTPAWSQFSVGGRGKELFRGNIAHAAAYAYAVPSNLMAGEYYSAIYGLFGAGNYTYTRLSEMCRYVGLGALQTVYKTGYFNPALVGGQQIAGNPLDAMRLVEATEDGMFYLGGDGLPYFLLRNFRFNSTPFVTIPASRIDPDSLAFRGDDFGLVNDVTASRPEGATIRVVNESSRVAHGRRKASLNAVTASDSQLSSLAARQAYGFGVDRNRMTGLRISLLNDPTLIPSVLSLAPGYRMAVTTLPTAQAPAATLEVFAEGWEEVISEQEWSMTFVTSAAEPWNVWQLGVPGRSELGTTTYLAY